MPHLEHENSYYAATANLALNYPVLVGDHQCDVCVIGGGLTGVSTALHLAQKGYDVILLEANRMGWGASGRNGGQFIHGYSCEQSVLEKNVGKANAKILWDLSIEALHYTKQLIEEHNINCDLSFGHISVGLKPRQRQELIEWKEGLEKEYGYDVLQFYEAKELKTLLNSDRYIAGVFDPQSGHLHTLNYTLGLTKAAEAAGAKIFEGSRVINVQHTQNPEVRTEQGNVKCNYLVLAANAYLGGLEAKLDSKIMPVGTYITATEPLGKELAESLITNNMAVSDINFVLDYYRLSKDYRMLFGGEVSYSKMDPWNLATMMRKRMITVFPQLTHAKIEYTWGGYVAITMNRAPHFGRLKENIYFCQGYSGHGVALTGFAGKLMADAISGTDQRFDIFEKISHFPFPGGKYLRTPALVLAMAYFRMRDLF